ncbi:hypothetical protein ACFLT9_11190 [Acidobacteriota bacterium]
MNCRTISIFMIAGLMALAIPARGQFTSDEISEFEKWEEFLKTAEVISSEQMGSREAVTNPWVLTLEKDGVTRKGLWKNPKGRLRGYVEGWQWEIAAYRIDRLLGLNMVPPTVERRFQGDRGSIQLWMEDVITLKDLIEDKIKMPPSKRPFLNRALYIQRTFDNLIANEDRHQNQYLITKDWRTLLIDHSRSFRTGRKFTANLIYNEKYKSGDQLMKQLPRILYEKIKTLTQELIKEVVGDYLTPKEIEAVMKRKKLITAWIDKRCLELGEHMVLY